jgi:hypothetical protein
MKKLRDRGKLADRPISAATTEAKLMTDIAIKEVIGKLPAAELDNSLTTFVDPLLARMPDQRLRRVIPRAIRGILGSESPVITKMAQTVARTENGVWAAAKQFYRLLANKRLKRPYFRRDEDYFARVKLL